MTGPEGLCTIMGVADVTLWTTATSPPNSTGVISGLGTAVDPPGEDHLHRTLPRQGVVHNPQPLLLLSPFEEHGMGEVTL